jgi:hypothetical protein
MKDLLNIETLFKVLGSIVASFMLLATPEKIIVTGLAIMLVCVFFFSIWAYFQTRKAQKHETDARELFLQRYLLTEARTNKLTDIHIRRHPEDGAIFFELERLAAMKRFEDLQGACGSCSSHDKKD